MDTRKLEILTGTKKINQGNVDLFDPGAIDLWVDEITLIIDTLKEDLKSLETMQERYFKLQSHYYNMFTLIDDEINFSEIGLELSVGAIEIQDQLERAENIKKELQSINPEENIRRRMEKYGYE